MALDEQKLLQSYRMLHEVFPEDLHIARPLIHMLLQHELRAEAGDLALSMARRMLAGGHAAHASSFLSLCRQLNHPNIEDIDFLYDMASFSIDGNDNESEQRFVLIEQLSDTEGLDFIRQGKLMQVQGGDVIVRQGERSKTFYLILCGAVDVRISLKDGHAITVHTLAAGDFFGEFACVYQLRRSASVIASEQALLLEFSAQALDQLMHASPMAGDYLIHTVQSRMIDAMTHSMPAFAELPEADRLWLAEEASVHEYALGETIPALDPAQPACHILLFGRASIQLPNGFTAPLATGMMFGSASPHIRLPSQATIKASEQTLVCSMPGNIFHTFMNVYAGFEQQIKTAGAPLPLFRSARPQNGRE